MKNANGQKKAARVLILKVSLWVSSLGDEIAEITEGCSAPKCSLPTCVNWARREVLELASGG